MIKKDINIKTPDGTMNSFVVYPDEGGPFPLILFLMDAPGKREELHDMAIRLSTCGYYVLLPNLYYRRTKDFILDRTPQENREKMYEHMFSLTNSMVLNDIKKMIEVSKNDNYVNDGPVGAIGYCMSGPFVFYAASRLNNVIKSTASIHGVRLFTEDNESPHLHSENINGEIYFAVAEHDEHVPLEMIEKLDESLSSKNINYRIEIFRNTEHGFVFPRRGKKYSKVEAEIKWNRVISMFDRNLR